MPKYHLLTFGCQMNKADSERIAAALEKKGYRPVSDIKRADLIVVNMCSVRQSAVNRVYGLIQKFRGLGAKTVLTGCILNRDKRKFSLHFDEIKPMSKTACPSQFIPISNGCNNFCAYCVVPYTRGRLACRPHHDILQEIKKSVKRGQKEIWLLGQNVNDYRSKTVDFAKLIKSVDSVPGDFKFFFTSPHPKNFTDKLIETLSKCKKYGRYLNLPIQSGDDQILKKMRRPYTIGQYKTLVKKIRRKMPNINLTTDVIVGFPGESKKQFQNTVKLFKEIKFNLAYISKYSPRPSTAAFRMKDDVPVEEKKRREKCLRKLLSS